MNRKALMAFLGLSLICIGSTFAIDYSKYKNEQFTVPKTNPAYLMIAGGNAADLPLVKDKNNNWVFPLGPFWYVSLPQAVLNKILAAKDKKDNFILFYQRKGNYVDISKYTGTTDPDLIRRDNKGQLEYIEATAKTYTFTADDILPYSELMAGVPEDMRRILLEEENRGNDYNDYERTPIFFAFAKGQVNGARDYINKRISKAQTLNAGTVHKGYKPCFGSGNTYSSEYDKIAVYGYIYSATDWSKMEKYYALRDEVSFKHLRLDTNSVNLFFEMNPETKAPKSNDEYWGIVFVSKTSVPGSEVLYALDDVIHYPQRDFGEDVSVLDTWILENADN